MVGALPQNLDSIEFRAIGRQRIQIQAILGPLAPLLVYMVALVDAGVVNQDDSWDLVQLRHNLVEERDYIIVRKVYYADR